MDGTSTRDQLIASTRELLWERGYSATSPKAILARAGAGQGSMYHYFAGKESLAAEALTHTAAELITQAGDVLHTPGTAQDRLAAYLLRQREALRGCPIGRMAGDADVLGSPLLHDILTRTFDEIRSQISTTISDGIAAGDFHVATDPAQLADTVLAVVQGGYVLARAAGTRAPFDRAVQGAVELILRTRGERA